MATYKVIQDIEAEDKFLGPLTLKQFIFGAGSAFFVWLSFFAATRGATFLLAVFAPPALLGAFLAIPWSSDQPTEVWVLAKLRFKLKPKTRIWDQAGLEELVTITAPKQVEKPLTNGLDPTEVQSRLKALAETIDTRGWAVKNATLAAGQNQSLPQIGERLISIDTLPREVPDVDLNQYTDVLDEDTTVSENFEHMIQESTQIRKRQSLDKMQRIRNGEPLETIQQPEVHFAPPTDVAASNVSAELDEKSLAQQLRNKRQASDLANNHLKTLQVYPGASSLAQSATQPTSDDTSDDTTAAAPATLAQPQAEMTNTPDPAILNLAQNNDWNIETIARQAKRNDSGENEVVISLR